MTVWKYFLNIFISLVCISFCGWNPVSSEEVHWIGNNAPESSAAVSNPERGWYYIRTCKISDKAPVCDDLSGSFRRDGLKDITLSLIRIDLHEYRSGAISESGLNQIRGIFKLARERHIKLIVRLTYDLSGKGMANEPDSLSVVITHIRQLSPILREYSDAIYTLQGFLVGSWAEMHDSKFLSDSDVRLLFKETAASAAPETFLAVRTPSLWRICTNLLLPLNEDASFNKSAASRLGLFNDALFSSDTDCGTYAELDSDAEDWFMDARKRNEELDFQNRLNEYVPNGGEMNLNSQWNDFESALEGMREIHISYLNCDYNTDVLDKWKKDIYTGSGVFNGKNGLDYIGTHLGYRFVLRNISADFDSSKRGVMKLNLSIENVGFSGLYYPKKIEIILYKKGFPCQMKIELPNEDIRRWKSGMTQNLSVNIPINSLSSDIYLVYLKISDKISNSSIQLANTGIFDTVLKANYLGKIIIE